MTSHRANEVSRGEWREFDLGGASWRLPGDPKERAFPELRDGNGTAKNGIAHTLPLSPTALNVRAECAKDRVGDRGRFFRAPGDDSKPTDNIRATVERAIKAAASETEKRRQPAQREDFTRHDMRRICFTTLKILEAPDAVVNAALNQADKRRVTAFYMRMMSDEKLRMELLRKWPDRLAEHYASLTPKAIAANGKRSKPAKESRAKRASEKRKAA